MPPPSVPAGEPPTATRPLVIIGLIAGFLTWSTASLVPAGTLDDSWRAAMYMVLEDGRHFGPEIDFTYGPLSFLVIPYVFNQWLGLLAWVVTSAIHLILCVAIALVTRRQQGWPAKIGLIALGAVASLYVRPLVSVSCLLLLVLLHRPGLGMFGLSRRRSDLVIVGIVGAIGALAILAKLNDGLVALVVGVAIAATGPTRIRGLLVFGAVFAITFSGAWVVTGQRLSDINDWIGGSREIIAGYSSAMSLPGVEHYPQLDGTLVNVLVGLAATASLLVLWLRIRTLRPDSWLPVFLAFAFFLFVGYKEGTVRHAPMGFFASLLIAVGWIPNWRLEPRHLRAVALPVVGAAFLVAVQFNAASLMPVERVSGAPAQLATLLDERTYRLTVETAKADLRAGYGVPTEMLTRIGGRGVHIAPYDTGVIWAYPGLTWSPLPVFQAYSAYTADLDARNAAVLASAAGPEFVLRRPNATIDRRSEWYEAPRSMLALACNFREVMTGGKWQLLERQPDRCSGPRPLGSATVRPGETVTIPIPIDSSVIVTARIRGFESDPIERLRALLASSSIWTIALSGGSKYRLVPGTADGPLIVADGSHLTYPGNSGAPTANSFVIAAGEAFGTAAVHQPDVDLVVEFELIVISP